jgi:hypothetical protein
MSTDGVFAKFLRNLIVIIQRYKFRGFLASLLGQARSNGTRHCWFPPFGL